MGFEGFEITIQDIISPSSNLTLVGAVFSATHLAVTVLFVHQLQHSFAAEMNIVPGG